MWSYLSPIDLSGSVFSQSIFHLLHVFYHFNLKLCIVTDFILVFTLFIMLSLQIYLELAVWLTNSITFSTVAAFLVVLCDSETLKGPKTSQLLLYELRETNTFEPSKDWECGTEGQRSALFLS